jgi:arylsulfatase A-like enzyme
MSSLAGGSVPDRRESWFEHERPFSATGKKPEGRPNIVFIFADDLGWGDLGSYGSLHNSTPNLDRLAGQGLRFTQGYAGSPTCSPSRMALMTGRYPGRVEGGLQEPLVLRDERSGLPPEHPNLASLLHDSGYATALFGKWHLGWQPWFGPNKSGFETFWGSHDGAVDYFSHIDTRGEPDLWQDETPIEEDGYYTELVAQHTVEYIESRRDDERPFFISVNFNAPHWPWEGPNDRETSRRVTEAVERGEGTGLFHFEGGSLATYLEMVKALDDGVGEILDALEKGGFEDDTMVIFMSDNGGERYAFLWPFVGEKGDLEEGGIRVPLILRWPSAVAGGQVTDVPLINLDLTATLLDAAGAEPHPDYPLDGVSLLSWLVEGEPYPEHDLLWRTREQGALRRGRYKLLVDRQAKPLAHGLFGKEGPRVRLFDLEPDHREKADVSWRHPELTAELLERWQRFDEELLPYPELPRIELPGVTGGLAD